MKTRRKRLDWTVLIIGAIGSLASTVCSAQETPQEILARWRAGQEAFERMIWRIEVHGQNRESVEAPTTFSGVINEFRADGQRFDLLVWAFPELEHSDAELISIEGEASRRMIWDGHRHYFIDRESRLGGNVQPGYVRVEVTADRNNEGRFCGTTLLGVFGGDHVPFDAILAEAPTLTLRQEAAREGGTRCYVIDAETSSGHYAVWFDPMQGYQIVRAEVRKSEDDIYGGRPLNQYRSQSYALASAGLPPGVTLSLNPLPELVSYSFDLTSATYVERDGVWVPMTCQYEDVLEDERIKTWNQVSFKTLDMDCDPDFTATDAFKPDVPDGTAALISGVGTPCTWKNGKVVDSYGLEVDPEHAGPPSLVGKALPSLTDFGLSEDAVTLTGRRLLVCFWDMDQRPSRSGLLALGERAQALQEAGVRVVSVHVGAVSEQVTAWLNENAIRFPVGCCNVDQPVLEHTWGVQSLPWLILSDENHTVKVEGFSIEEIETAIGKITDGL